jgi:signal transduction histidine kinase
LTQDFAVILLDVNLPGMDGFETAAMIRQRKQSEHTPIIFTSSISTTETHAARGYSLGAVDYIFTPMVPEILRSKVAVFVELAKKSALVRKQAELLAHSEQAARGLAEARAVLLADLESKNLALERAMRETERANAAKSEFVSRMSHELRTPLNAILGFGQLLELDNLGPQQRESVTCILRGGRHLLDLINEVLDIARIEAGHLVLLPEAVPVKEVGREAVELVAPLARQWNIALDDRTADASWALLGDRQRLKQVLLNLLSNAVKYTPQGGGVRLWAEEAPEGRLRISVRDTGVGIPPDRMARLFTPFDRLGAEQTKVEGTGLGLALSKRLMEAMGGTIGATSEVGRGSTFWMELARANAPVRPADPVQTDGKAPARAGEVGALTVLYIEDNLSNVELVQRILALRGKVKFLTAMQGQAGLDLAHGHAPDVILLDLHLPDIPGDEVLRRLRAAPDTRGTPVIMLSADAMPGRVEQLLAAGAQAYVTKPIDVRQFLKVLEETLR